MIPHDGLVTESSSAPISSSIPVFVSCSSWDAACAAIMLGASMRMFEEHTLFPSVSGSVDTSMSEGAKGAPTLVATLVAALPVS